MITKSALLVTRQQNGTKEILFARSFKNPLFVFPGGKTEEGESLEDSLHREIREELGVGIKNFTPIDKIEGATPDGRPLIIHIFTGTTDSEPTANAEIKELRWFSRAEALANPQLFTPIGNETAFPLFSKRQLW